MIVVGGAYEERCRDPQSIRFAGSGLRAAAVLAGVDPDVELVSAVDEAHRDVANSTCAALRVRRRWWTVRDAPVGFQYDTPLSSPVMGGTASRTAEPVHAEGDAVLLFGMIEATPTVQARTLVIDPQHSLTVEDIKAQRADRLAIVANRAEAVALAGTADPEDAARQLLAAVGADSVVVKLGAMGVLIVTATDARRIGALPTPRTWPIGSGDAFSAGFAWAFTQGATAVGAAAVGCSTAATWCSTQTLPLPAPAFETTPAPAPARVPRVYLAGPFFDMAQRWLVELVYRALKDLGAEVFSPLHDVGYAVPEAAAADLAGLASCQSVMALLDGADPGTLFEVGWATDHGTPVTGFCQRGDPEALTMVQGSGTTVYDDLSSAVYRSIWAGIE